ncbi:MAG TPA: IclR family transcriptional regulator C-terminal domain-containing protein [Casimicrobiaceae bacterium]|nr:IclR family transcriptional regulator C-terminal domain-containing protein [Casimicrobiaceae bacterium]
MAVLLAFSQKRRRMSIAQVSHRTGVSRAAVRRCLHTLACIGFVGVDEGNRFYLRPKILSLGEAYLSATPLTLVGQPILDRLSDELQESCSLGVLDGDEVVYVARSISSRILSTTLNIGRRMPSYCSAIGRAVLGTWTPQALDPYLARITPYPFTRHTITSKDALRQVFANAARTGYAIADEQMEPGFCTMAVPARDSAGAVVGGINVVLRAGRVPVRGMPARYLGALQHAANELERVLHS